MKEFFKKKYKQSFTSTRMTFGERVLLAIPSMPAYLITILLFTVLFKYFTDVVGLDPILVGSVFMLLSIWNAINDPLIGIMLDKMPYIPNKGKYLYVAKFCVPFICIPVFLLLFVQSTWSEFLIYTYMLSMLVVYEAGATAYGTCINSYIFVRIHDTQERIEYSLLVTYMSYIFSGVITLIPLLMFVDDRPSYFITPAIMIVLALNTLLFWYGLKNLKDDASYYTGDFVNEDAQFAKDFIIYTKDIIKLKGFWITNILAYLIAMSVAYYFTYYLFFVDDILNVSGFQSFLIDTGNGIIAFLVVPIVPVISRKIGVKNTCILSLVPAMLGFFLLYFTNGPILLAFSFLLIVISNMSFMILLASPLRFLIIDEDWQRTGKRKVGFISALNGLVMKPANGMRAMLFGMILSMYGYNGAESVQTEQALQGIRVASSIVPFVILIGALVAVLLLPYNHKREKEIIALREEMENDRNLAV